MIITITGPRSVGKTTISKLVAEKLKLKWVSSDEIAEKAMKRYGGLDKAIKSGVIKNFIKEGAYSLIRNVYEKNNIVIDLSGGSVSSRKFSEVSRKVRRLAKEKSIVIGLLPCSDDKKSVSFLLRREKKRTHFRKIPGKKLLRKVNDDYKKFPKLFLSFCDFIIYVENKNPADVAKEIVRAVGR
jgi:shikimate kinase